MAQKTDDAFANTHAEFKEIPWNSKQATHRGNLQRPNNRPSHSRYPFRTTPAPLGPFAKLQSGQPFPAYLRAAFALSTMAVNASGWLTAISASILRSNSIPARPSPKMNFE